MRKILGRFASVAYVARELGVDYKRASKWAERDSLPASFDLKIVDLARREGISLSLEEIAQERAEHANSSQALGEAE